jgi:hypothetical protein
MSHMIAGKMETNQHINGATETVKLANGSKKSDTIATPALADIYQVPLVQPFVTPPSNPDTTPPLAQPPQLPLTPQSCNKGIPPVELSGDTGPPPRQRMEDRMSGLTGSEEDGSQLEEVGVEVIRAPSPSNGVDVDSKHQNQPQKPLQQEEQLQKSQQIQEQDPLPPTTTSAAADKSFERNVSALSISTGEGELQEQTSLSWEDSGGDTPKSSLVSNKKFANGNNNCNEIDRNVVDVIPEAEMSVASGTTNHSVRTGGDGSVTTLGTTNHSVRLGELGDFMGDTNSTAAAAVSGGEVQQRSNRPPPLMVQVDGGEAAASAQVPSPLSPTPVSNNSTAGRPRAVKTSSSHRGRTKLKNNLKGVPARSPRPPRHMRAVDWCPPGSEPTGSSSSRVSASAAPSDTTMVTSRAVRLGDDATVTTFATMTTMGDAGSILEADTEDEASSSSGSDEEMEEGSDEEADNRTEDDEESMEDVEYANGVVDKIPSAHASTMKAYRTGSISGTTNHAVRALDDQSVVTFGTVEAMGPGGTDVVIDLAESTEQDMVDKIPHIPDHTDNSMVTNDTVQMGDNQSLATWATTNTMGGQLTGNVVDHVPEDENDDEEESAITVGTSNAVKEDPSVTTFATAATNERGDSVINEVVDKIPSFAGGISGSGRSISTSQAVRATGVVGDDNASFATMTTMGDLGSIFETEVMEDNTSIPASLPYYDGYCTRPRLFSGSSGIIDEDDEIIEGLNNEIDRNVVDVIPEAASSVASGTTNHSVRDEDGVSVGTFGTMTTAGLQPSGGGGQRSETDGERNENEMVDHVPDRTPSIVSGTTNHAVRLNDDQSVATWATTTTSAMLTGQYNNEHVVDKTPDKNPSDSDNIISEEATNAAMKDPEDQSVVTWNTMTTAGANRPPPRSVDDDAPEQEPSAVDRVPSFSNTRAAVSLSGTTNHAIRDDQSVVTFATMTSAGDGMYREREREPVVDRLPSYRVDDRSVVTNDTVLVGDNQSLATWATGKQMTGNMVDHVPDEDEQESCNITVGTSNAIKDEPSVTTFTTSATSSGITQGINEVVDKVPTFAGGSGRSIASGITNQAVHLGDDNRSLASFATMTSTAGGGSLYGETPRVSNNLMLDRIPSSACAGEDNAPSISGRTDYAVRLGDDLTVNTFATMTTAGGGGGVGSSDQSVEENDVRSISSLSRLAQPTAGILRKTSALRDNRDYRASVSDSAASAVLSSAMAATPLAAESSSDPINRDVEKRVSNDQVMRAISDLRFHLDYRLGELRELNRRDSERVTQILQQEQAKRTALEARLHSQLLLQSETMVAMELKLLRLEAEAAHRDSRRQRSSNARPPGGIVGGGTTINTTNITDRLPPIAATPSTPNRSDEEVEPSGAWFWTVQPRRWDDDAQGSRRRDECCGN